VKKHEAGYCQVCRAMPHLSASEGGTPEAGRNVQATKRA